MGKDHQNHKKHLTKWHFLGIIDLGLQYREKARRKSKARGVLYYGAY